ncbi:protein FAR1-RELATED SEQUENCE 9-like [Carya illinoinensis]|uniref:protein FAR1-RELATED SEQUENCE 9-like n=1 Tax=Carya illinoinensis TaxID=32201 RepID=UPI001C71DA75|nr:protein FAR1-RELATED SEQUENCE 9-like [Carya illinoinensis]
MGILCKHILCVFGKKSKLDRLPQHYVMERWTINAKSQPIPDIPSPTGLLQLGLDDPTMRKSKSMIQLYDIVELGSQSEEKHSFLTRALKKIHKKLLAMEDHVDTEGTHYSNRGETCSIDQDPPRVPTKGRPKSLRSKNPKETQTTKKRRCSICKAEGHAKKQLPFSKGSSANICQPVTTNVIASFYMEVCE